MIATACSNYSMRAMDLFAADVPRGLSDPATWFIYDQPMAAHGFLAYMLEIYLVMAADLGALDVVHAFFTSFVRAATAKSSTSPMPFPAMETRYQLLSPRVRARANALERAGDPDAAAVLLDSMRSSPPSSRRPSWRTFLSGGSSTRPHASSARRTPRSFSSSSAYGRATRRVASAWRHIPRRQKRSCTGFRSRPAMGTWGRPCATTTPSARRATPSQAFCPVRFHGSRVHPRR